MTTDIVGDGMACTGMCSWCQRTDVLLVAPCWSCLASYCSARCKLSDAPRLLRCTHRHGHSHGQLATGGTAHAWECVPRLSRADVLPLLAALTRSAGNSGSVSDTDTGSESESGSESGSAYSAPWTASSEDRKWAAGPVGSESQNRAVYGLGTHGPHAHPMGQPPTEAECDDECVRSKETRVLAALLHNNLLEAAQTLHAQCRFTRGDVVRRRPGTMHMASVLTVACSGMCMPDTFDWLVHAFRLTHDDVFGAPFPSIQPQPQFRAAGVGGSSWPGNWLATLGAPTVFSDAPDPALAVFAQCCIGGNMLLARHIVERYGMPLIAPGFSSLLARTEERGGIVRAAMIINMFIALSTANSSAALAWSLRHSARSAVEYYCCTMRRDMVMLLLHAFFPRDDASTQNESDLWPEAACVLANIYRDIGASASAIQREWMLAPSPNGLGLELARLTDGIHPALSPQLLAETFRNACPVDGAIPPLHVAIWLAQRHSAAVPRAVVLARLGHLLLS